jgi:hypothetical protein
MGRTHGHVLGGILVKAGKLMGKVGSVSVKGLTAVGKAVTRKK